MATSISTQDTRFPFKLPSLFRKKVTAAFDGGQLSQDGGVFLLAAADKALGLSQQMAAVLPDKRDPSRIKHSFQKIIQGRIQAIACGWEDANDFDTLRSDPAFKISCNHLPRNGDDLFSQPTLSRLENTPKLKTLLRLGATMIKVFCDSYSKPPKTITLDIDETCDEVHGHQQLSLFNGYYDVRCFMPMHIYDTETGRPVAVILRPGKSPSGIEIRGQIRRVIRHIRRYWPETLITLRGDSHYGREEVMDWCDAHGIGYIFGFAGNAVLYKSTQAEAEATKKQRTKEESVVARAYADISYKPKKWKKKRRVCVRIEATEQGVDRRFVITSIAVNSAETIYSVLYCRRGQAENLIKLHKGQLASDRTSCRSPLANQMRLFLHTAAYWLILKIKENIPKHHQLWDADFATIRLKLLKISVRVIEATTRIRLAFASSHPHASLFRFLIGTLKTASP